LLSPSLCQEKEKDPDETLTFSQAEDLEKEQEKEQKEQGEGEVREWHVKVNQSLQKISEDMKKLNDQITHLHEHQFSMINDLKTLKDMVISVDFSKRKMRVYVTEELMEED